VYCCFRIWRDSAQNQRRHHDEQKKRLFVLVPVVFIFFTPLRMPGAL
jgi:hypothetical protein